MYKLSAFLFFAILSFSTHAQKTLTQPKDQPFGKVSMDDLKLQSCDFEKDANAEVLFDKGIVFFDLHHVPILERHRRIKIFNEKGKYDGNVKIFFFGGKGGESVGLIKAETINLENGKEVITKVDKKQIFTQQIDNYRSVLVLAFPDVRTGSVLDLEYNIAGANFVDFPSWYFQSTLPTRYSELQTNIPAILHYKNLVMVKQPFVFNTDNDKVMMNIPSLEDEPFMTTERDNEDRVLYELKGINTTLVYLNFSDTWEKVGNELLNYEDFGGQLSVKLPEEKALVDTAKKMKSRDEKIAFLFDTVKNRMRWNEVDERFVNDGTRAAWKTQIGNSTEINLILYHLLQKSGVKVYPMLVSTRKNGKINPAYPNSYQFNRTVVYVPIDSTNFYILDATNKYNSYKEIPETLLNNFGFLIDKKDNKFNTVFIQNNIPVRRVSLINAEITPDGKIKGHTEISYFGYHRIDQLQDYNSKGENSYKEELTDSDNNLKITNLKFKNMDVDTLPLVQDIDFNLNLPSAADNYIYFTPALFTGLGKNPFLSEKRSTDIDFGYQNACYVSGVYKIPAGYTIDELPKNITLETPGGSIVCRRLIAAVGNTIVVRYNIYFKKSIFFKEDYPEIYTFYKKMYEMLNEQIVLKKA